MAHFAYNAHDIDISGISVDRELSVAFLDQALADVGVSATGPGRVQARISRSGREIVVHGRAEAPLRMPCARCMEPAAFTVDGEITLLLKPVPLAPPAKAVKAGAANGKAKSNAEPEYEIGPGEAEIDVFDGENVVLDDFIREAIVLELPNFPLCSETCPGIGAGPAPADEAHEKLDPRLAPLRALQEKLAKKPDFIESPDPLKKKKE